MLGGGFLPGTAMLIAGPAGSGKSSLAIQFLAEGVQRGEPGVLAMFEETPIKYLEQATGFGLDLQQMSDEKKLKLIYLRPLDLSVDETLEHPRTVFRQPSRTPSCCGLASPDKQLRRAREHQFP